MKGTILIIEDDVIFSRSISNWLRKQEMDSERVTTLTAARKALSGRNYDLVLADLRLPDGNSTELLRWMHRDKLPVPFLIMTNYVQVENAVEAMRLGAVDYLCKPVHPDRLLEVISKVLSHTRHDLDEFYRGESDKAREMHRQIGLVSLPDISVLIRGASGTGKEHIARELHMQSRRKNRPYVPVDCGSISEELAASEFFGHRKGAFTGADSDKSGLFREADGGTLFLDEIGEISLLMQVKLLRAIQQREIQRVGGDATLKVDVRIVAATNRNLLDEVAAGRFREDLYYRLNVVSIQVPSLQERSEDIPLLAEHFLKVFGERNRKDVKGFTPKAMDMLIKYPWPGNVRELENAVERAVVLLFGSYVSERELPLAVTQAYEQEDDTEPSALSVPLEGATLEDVEREAILRMLDSVGDNKSEAAKRLGISRKTLHTKLKRYGQEQD